jgi:hypothetical protein
MKAKKMLAGILLIISITIPALQNCYAKGNAKQGIAGEVVWTEGNNMPGVGVNTVVTKKVAREIVVYPMINQKDVTSTEAPFYSNVNIKSVAKGKSGKNGKFFIRLPQGKYSVFVLEKGKLYANSLDGDGNINPVEVNKNKVTISGMIINYEAVY